MSNCTIMVKQLCSQFLIGGGRGRSPLQEKRCHPEERPQAYATKDLVLTELFLGQRGAITMKSAVNYRIILTKCFVRTF